MLLFYQLYLHVQKLNTSSPKAWSITYTYVSKMIKFGGILIGNSVYNVNKTFNLNQCYGEL